MSTTVTHHREPRPTTVPVDAAAGTDDRGVVTGHFPWAARGWPSSLDEERRFVADLEELTGGRECAWTRRDVTAVVNALRSGTSVARLLALAPGLRPERLLAAYRSIDGARLESRIAWNAVVWVGDETALRRYGPEAGRLIPGIIGPLLHLAETCPSLVPEAVRRADERCRAAREYATALEERLRTPDHRGDTRVRSALYHPELPCVWSDPYYSATRVTDLVPDRLRTLLGESTGA